VGALVVGAVVGDLLGAGAQAGHRDDDLHRELVLAAGADRADEGDFVVQQALHAGDRRRLVDEVGEAHLDVAGFGLELPDHLAQHRLEGLDRDLAIVAVEDLDEARHVGALEIVGQPDVHVEQRDGVLHACLLVLHLDGVADGLDADLVDGDLAGVLGILDVRNCGGGGAGGHECSQKVLLGLRESGSGAPRYLNRIIPDKSAQLFT
jgi:hypothetical protein